MRGSLLEAIMKESEAPWMNKNVVICGAASSVAYHLLLELLHEEDVENIWLFDKSDYHMKTEFTIYHEGPLDLYQGMIVEEGDIDYIDRNEDMIHVPTIKTTYLDMLNETFRENDINVVFDLVETAFPSDPVYTLIKTNISFHTDLCNIINENQRNHVTKVIVPYRSEYTNVSSMFDYTLNYKKELSCNMNFANNIYTTIEVPRILDINQNPYMYGNTWMQSLYGIKYGTANIHYHSMQDLIGLSPYCLMSDFISTLMKAFYKNHRHELHVPRYAGRVGSQFVNPISLIKYLSRKYKHGFVFFGNLPNDELNYQYDFSYNFRKKIYIELGRIAERYLEADDE